jgi:hypothetical protein
MLVQVGATSPPLRPAPMTKLDLLLQQAEVRARRASSARRTTPSAVSYDPRQCSLARRRREGTTHALVPALMRAGDVVAYSILTARWSATPPESWKRTVAYSVKRASKW